MTRCLFMVVVHTNCFPHIPHTGRSFGERFLLPKEEIMLKFSIFDAVTVDCT